MAPTASRLVVTLLLVVGCQAGSAGRAGDVPRDDGDAVGQADGALPDQAAGAADGGETADGPGQPSDAVCGAPDCTAAAPRYLTTLATLAEFEALAANGVEVKYFAQHTGAPVTPPIVESCYFQNTRQFRWHIDFLHDFVETADLPFAAYSAWALWGETRRWWVGTLRRWPASTHPTTGLVGVVTFQIFNEDVVGNPVPITGIIELGAQLKACAPFAADRLAFLPLGTSQTQAAVFYRDVFEAAGVTVVLPADLAEAHAVDVLSPGEGYGYLNVVAEGYPLADYGPRDVVVVSSAPADIGLVAGLVTANPQNRLSHVNLRLAEKGIPNASVPTVYAWPELDDLRGSLVHIFARDQDVRIEPAALSEAEAFWAEHRPPRQPVRSDLGPRDMRGFEALAAADAPAFGAKAANLGEIHRVLQAENRVAGFGIPVVHYAEFVTARGVQTAIDDLLADPRVQTDAAVRRQALSEIRRRIRAEPLLPDFEDALRARLLAQYGAEALQLRVRFRSSSNAEDLVSWSGAGLYDSRSGCLGDDLDGDTRGPSACLGPEEQAVLEQQLAERREQRAACAACPWLDDIIEEIEEDLADEKPVADAVRKVWASLWNERAFEERGYWGIAHDAVYMAIAVHPTFVLESRDAVAVTGRSASAGGTVYEVISQVSPESVVRPADPTAIPETMTFLRLPGDPLPHDVSVPVFSSLSPGAAPLWDAAEIQELARLLFTVHDHFAGLAWPPDAAPSAFEIEIKKDASGHIVLKQARPYLLGL